MGAMVKLQVRMEAGMWSSPNSVIDDRALCKWIAMSCDGREVSALSLRSSMSDKWREVRDGVYCDSFIATEDFEIDTFPEGTGIGQLKKEYEGHVVVKNAQYVTWDDEGERRRRR